MIATKAYAAHHSKDDLKPFKLERRQLRDQDVLIDIEFCGICHSDIHTVNSDWGPSNYPVVPGHEIVGKVLEVGAQVTKFKIGDFVGVGCLVDSCQKCESCDDGLEQYCTGGSTGTYNSKDLVSGGFTYGGYSDKIVVADNFVVKVPENIDPAGAAPLLCAGITTWSPLKNWDVKAGDKVEHQKFGFGEVLKLEGAAHNPIATVKFEHNGEKKIMLNYAKLRILE